MKTAAPLRRLVQDLRQAVELHSLDRLDDADLLKRFRQHGDPEAFTAIVRRHGRCVLAAGRKVLSVEADIEDMFQATFLVLLRDAGAIRQRGSLGSWLYSVAHRIALKARAAKARRQRVEQQVWSEASEAPDLSWREACTILHEELDRLPDKYRLPLLLCYLEGKSRDEAAQQLGVKLDTLRGRLERGRERLRRRLMKRGVGLSAGLFALVAANTVTAGGPSPNLIQATLAAALGQPSPAVASLLQLGSVAVFTGKVRLLGAALLLVGLLATAGFLQSYWSSEPPPQKQTSVVVPVKELVLPVAAEKADPDPADVFTYAGRILDPNGKPLKGAKVYICGLRGGVIEFKPRATTETDGTFRFTVKREEFQVRRNEQPGSRVWIGATAPNSGAAVAFASKAEDREKLTLWLPQEQLVTGRILDLEGKPIAGVKVGTSIRSAQWGLDGRPVAFDVPIDKVLSVSNILPSDPDEAPVESDKDGRFTIHGLGKDWLYDLWIAGPTIEHRRARLVARPQKPKQVPGSGVYTEERGDPKLIQYGSEFVYVAAPSKPIIGVVRDKDTGKPIAGARVGKQWTRDDEPSGWTTTDAEGRYRLEGLPAAVHELTVEPPKDTPYLRTTARAVADKPGHESAKCDIEMLRQRLVRGRVTERVTGKPVSGWVEYRPLAGNPNLKSAPHLAEPRWPPHQMIVLLDKEGRFSIPTLPGRGVLVVKAEGTFLPAQLTEGDRKSDVLDTKDAELLDTKPLPLWVPMFHAYRVVDVKADDKTCDLTVDAGRSLPLTVLAPDGKPCTGGRSVWIRCRSTTAAKCRTVAARFAP